MEGNELIMQLQLLTIYLILAVSGEVQGPVFHLPHLGELSAPWRVGVGLARAERVGERGGGGVGIVEVAGWAERLHRCW